MEILFRFGCLALPLILAVMLAAGAAALVLREGAILGLAGVFGLLAGGIAPDGMGEAVGVPVFCLAYGAVQFWRWHRARP